MDFSSEGGGKDSEVQNIYRQHGFMCKGTEQEKNDLNKSVWLSLHEYIDETGKEDELDPDNFILF